MIRFLIKVEFICRSIVILVFKCEIVVMFIVVFIGLIGREDLNSFFVNFIIVVFLKIFNFF